MVNDSTGSLHMQHAQRLNGESWRRTARNTFVTRLASVIAALGVIAVCAPSAYARQVAEAHWSGARTKHGWWVYVPILSGSVAVGETISSSSGCAGYQFEASLSHTSTSLDFHITSDVYEKFPHPWIVRCVAGPAQVMLVLTRGDLSMEADGQSFGQGGTVTLQPGESVDFKAGILGDAQVLIIGGSLAMVDSGGEMFFYDPACYCTFEADWNTSGQDCEWKECPYPGCLEWETDSYGTASATELEAGVGALSALSSLQCSFLLTGDCWVAYDLWQSSSPYASAYLDGAELQEWGVCGALKGVLFLRAGWHGLSLAAYESFTHVKMDFTPPPYCGSDCDDDGQDDCLEITWAWLYEGVCLDSDDDMQLDSCERAAGDLNLDGSVGSADLAMLLDDWWSGVNTNDINGDGVVNGFDLTTLLYFWGE